MYIVTICGYEGIERLFGPFSFDEAKLLAQKLKDRAPSGGEHDLRSASRHARLASKLAKELGIDFLSPFVRDQVCLMARRSSEALEATCCCHLLPAEYQNQKTWLM